MPRRGSRPPTSGWSARSTSRCIGVSGTRTRWRLVEIVEEIVSVLASEPNATVRLAVEISADFPDGASESLKRAVSENARSLGISKADWE